MKKKEENKSEDKVLEEARSILRENHTEKSLVGLFSHFDKLQLERIVGTASYKKMIKDEAKDAFNI